MEGVIPPQRDERPPDISAGCQQRPAFDPRVYRRLIYDTRIQPGPFRLWHYLNDRKNKAGIAFPAQRDIAVDLGCNPHSLARWIARLVTCGYLAIRKRGQNHHLVYTILCGDGLGVLPEWATRRNAQTDITGCCPNGSVAMTKGTMPRNAERGNESNNQVVNPESKRAPADAGAAARSHKREVKINWWENPHLVDKGLGDLRKVAR